MWIVNDIYDVIGWYLYELINNNERNDNHIGESGGCSIGEGLKVNSTLTLLNLGSEELMIYMMPLDDIYMNLWIIMREMITI